MKFSIVILCAAFTASTHAFSLRQLTDDCLQGCNSDSDCGLGEHCLSLGCNHVCLRSAALNPVLLPSCPLLACMDVYCPTKRAVDAYGCPTCHCQGLEVLQ